MANGPSLPPWISRIDPVQPATGFLQGFQTGSSAGAARRSAELQAQAMAMREAQAAIENQLARERAEQQRIEFQANLRIKEAEARRDIEKATREAQAAARQVEAQQNIQRGMASGQYKSWAEAYAYNPAAVPSAIGPALTQIGRTQQQDTGFWVPAGGFEKPGDVPFSFKGYPEELTGLTGVPTHRLRPSGQVQFVPQTATAEGRITPAERIQIDRWRDEITGIDKRLTPTESILLEDSEIEDLNTRKNKLNKAISKVISGEGVDPSMLSEPDSTPKLNQEVNKTQLRINLADKLKRDNPKWTKKQIIDEVKRQIP
jgi:hypothetical protein